MGFTYLDTLHNICHTSFSFFFLFLQWLQDYSLIPMDTLTSWPGDLPISWDALKIAGNILQ